MEAIKAGKPVWSSVYSWEINPFPLAIAHASPIYDTEGEIIGAIGVEQLLLQIRDFLRELEISPNSRTFILERDGMLIANSGDQQPFRVVNDLPVRLNVSESDSSVIKTSAEQLADYFGGFDAILESQQLSVTIDGERNFLQVMPWGEEIGLDWLVVVAVYYVRCRPVAVLTCVVVAAAAPSYWRLHSQRSGSTPFAAKIFWSTLW